LEFIVTTSFQSFPAPRHPDPRQSPVLRWGILAPGGIAIDFAKALLTYTEQRILAVGSRSADRAAEFAARFEIERSYGSYEDLVADPEIDVVYVASPHSQHREHALLAIAAGKNVLIEKPIAATANDAQAIVDAANAAGVFAMEAMWTRHLPHTDVARQLLENEVLGEVRFVTADFGGHPPFDAAGRLWNPELAGGALLDLGVYPLSWAFFGLEALRHGFPTLDSVAGSLASTGVDKQSSLVLTGADGSGDSQAFVYSGFVANTSHRAVIAGSAALVEVAPFWEPADLTLRIGRETHVWRDESEIRGRNGFAYEAAAVARYVREGLTDSPINPLHEAVAVLRLLDEARWALGYTALDD
jgi:predicted dehydrogenase